MHKSDELKNREELIYLFKKYNVDMVFSGHNHVYERFEVDGINYIVTGGGGSPLYDKYRDDSNLQVFKKSYNFVVLTIDKDSSTLKALDENGNLIDQLTSSGR